MPDLNPCAVFDYDPLTGVLRWKSGRRRAGLEAGCISTTGQCKMYRLVKMDGKLFYAHRIIWLMVHGEWPAETIDHINGDSLDNRLGNLRSATRTQNAQNRNLDQRSTTGVTGVHFNRRRKMYAVRIKANGKRSHIGYFETKDAAVLAANEARARLHGDFARQTS